MSYKFEPSLEPIFNFSNTNTTEMKMASNKKKLTPFCGLHYNMCGSNQELMKNKIPKQMKTYQFYAFLVYCNAESFHLPSWVEYSCRCSVKGTRCCAEIELFWSSKNIQSYKKWCDKRDLYTFIPLPRYSKNFNVIKKVLDNSDEHDMNTNSNINKQGGISFNINGDNSGQKEENKRKRKRRNRKKNKNKKQLLENLRQRKKIEDLSASGNIKSDINGNEPSQPYKEHLDKINNRKNEKPTNWSGNNNKDDIFSNQPSYQEENGNSEEQSSIDLYLNNIDHKNRVQYNKIKDVDKSNTTDNYHYNNNKNNDFCRVSCSGYNNIAEFANSTCFICDTPCSDNWEFRCGDRLQYFHFDCFFDTSLDSKDLY